MQKNFYFLSPVEVVKVSTSNLQEVAEWCGGKVATTESRRVPGRQDSYVWAPTPKGTAISWAFPGMFITKRLVRTIKDELRVTYAVFRRDYFEKNYFDNPTEAVAATWEKGMNTPNTQKKANKPSEMPKKRTDPEGILAHPAPPAMVTINIQSEGDRDVVEGIEKAVEALQEQGVLPLATNPVPEEQAALELIASSDLTDALEGNAKVVAQSLSPREAHDQQIADVSPGQSPAAKERELVPDHELRAKGLPASYQEGYKPVYRDEMPSDVTLSE